MALARTPCGFCFVEYYTHDEALAAMRYISGTKLDERVIRCDLDPGYREGRQFGRGKNGGQVRDEFRQEYDAGRGKPLLFFMDILQMISLIVCDIFRRWLGPPARSRRDPRSGEGTRGHSVRRVRVHRGWHRNQRWLCSDWCGWRLGSRDGRFDEEEGAQRGGRGGRAEKSSGEFARSLSLWYRT